MILLYIQYIYYHILCDLVYDKGNYVSKNHFSLFLDYYKILNALLCGKNLKVLNRLEVPKIWTESKYSYIHIFKFLRFISVCIDYNIDHICISLTAVILKTFFSHVSPLFVDPVTFILILSCWVKNNFILLMNVCYNLL